MPRVQFAFHRLLDVRRLDQCGLEHAEIVASRLLRRIERQIRLFQKRQGIDAVLRRKG